MTGMTCMIMMNRMTIREMNWTAGMTGMTCKIRMNRMTISGAPTARKARAWAEPHS